MLRKSITIIVLFLTFFHVGAQQIEICPNQPLPPDWVVVDVKDCAGCCGKKGGLAKLPTIRKLEHFPPDRFMKRYYKAGK